MGERVVSTWPAIARFFGKSVPTVRRWARRFPDFPLRKEFSAARGLVWSTSDELTQWATRHGVPVAGGSRRKNSDQQ